MNTKTLRSLQHLTRGLAEFRTLAQLRESGFFARNEAELRGILDVPQVFVPPTVSEFEHRNSIRVVFWNIERGNRFRAVSNALRTHPVLSRADVILLNEVDVGMVRTGNRHVGFDLAEELGMHCVFGPAYLEMTKGIGEELNLPGENTSALHGEAILSKFPLENPRLLRLPVCFEHYHFHEKRFGGRIVLLAEIRVGERKLGVMTSHLEVRDTPRCRARQMRSALDWARGCRMPIIFGGDFNSNTFSRGTLPRTLRSSARVILSDPSELKAALAHPEQGREPLFDELREAGFEIEEFNDGRATASVEIAGVEDADSLPRFLKTWIARRIEPHAGFLHFRLDWIACRGFVSVGPALTVTGLEFEGLPPSDHAPIVADVWFAD